APAAESDTGFGLLPHQLRCVLASTTVLWSTFPVCRGFLTRFDITAVVGQSFDRCTACSEKVISCIPSASMMVLPDCVRVQQAWIWFRFGCIESTVVLGRLVRLDSGVFSKWI